MQKSVQITVYVAKPTITNQEHVSGHRRRPLRNSGAGYDRKAQLLLYSQQLRNIACCELQASAQKTETFTKVREAIQIVSSYKSHSGKHPSAKKVVPVELQKPVQAKIAQPQPLCFRDWRNGLLPSFIGRIFGGGNGKNDEKNKKKMNAVMMSSRTEKERSGVMAKFICLTGKRS